MSCGPGLLGQCVGPDICCGPFGCQMGTSESNICGKENESTTACAISGPPCGSRNQGNCVADGICCDTGMKYILNYVFNWLNVGISRATFKNPVPDGYWDSNRTFRVFSTGSVHYQRDKSSKCKYCLTVYRCPIKCFLIAQKTHVCFTEFFILNIDFCLQVLIIR